MSVGFSVFLAPRGIVAGGFSGLALMLESFLRNFTDVEISIGVIYLLMNIPIYFFGFKNLGKYFVLMSLIGTVCYSIFIDQITLNIVVEDHLLCSLYGGIFSGIGLGFVVRGNGSTGGSDMVGMIVHKKFNKISIGNTNLIIDVVVVSLNVLYTKSLIMALYAVLSIYIRGIITDYIEEGPRAVKAVYIISEKSQEIAEKILYDLGRGTTGLYAFGGFSGKDKKMIMTLVSRRQMHSLNTIIFSIDETAFVFSTNCKDAIGNGFNKPDKINKSTELYKRISGEKIAKVNRIFSKNDEE